MSTNIISFAVVLGVLIFVHELGHFLLAKLLGVGVEKFSLGFGPKIIGKKIGMTEYKISAIPLGGYVKMVGESPEKELDDSLLHLSFSHKGLFRRSLIVLAGPVFNFLLSVVIFFVFFQVSGLPIMKPEVGEVQEGMPAYEGGIRPGDRITSIDGNPVAQWDEMAALIKQSRGRPLRIEILRDDSTVLVRVVPKLISCQNLFGEQVEKYVIGITASGAFTIQRLNLFQSAAQGVLQTWRIAKVTVLAIEKIFTGTLSTKTLGGPIMIAQLAGQQAKAGIINLIFFIALLSINLGIINLLPIPVLDGGHLLFFLIEAVSRRPINIKIREMAQQVGLFILILLMIFVFYNDISRILFD
ncbi:MAG: RIP metalloprotease RseP [Deltaproteobacteria bacterium]|nr:RIP metalloprotease RseP [Deltaproteobacteria bacterium]MBW2075487.1 RIP metalloprotease RseP [Deltaproteobacteria bacterium]RLB79909.1 MAG: RIP metalloprotease RseP [Deltaproteobacteria bacterium]